MGQALYTDQDCSVGFKPKTKLIQSITKKVNHCFHNLEGLSYLTPIDKRDFYWFRSTYQHALEKIDTKIAHGTLIPLDLKKFPAECYFPNYTLNATIYTGSFDPFQMTHLATILHHLAYDHGGSAVVFVVPEGAYNPAKPMRSNYEYRYKLLSLQLKRIFYPLIVPLDIGKDADTITIWKRFIDMLPCSTLNLTHLLGSDVLPYAISMLPEDLVIWKEEAEKKCVKFSYRAFILKRSEDSSIDSELKQLDSMGIEYQYHQKVLDTPSSTDFRTNNVFSIVFPTKEILSHLEILFRYRLHKPWTLQ